MTLFLWSKTAASNDSADPNINWVEGMPPPAVNNSARAMMAAFGKYRDDLAGNVQAYPFPDPLQGATFAATTFENFAAFPSTLTAVNGQLLTIVLTYPCADSPQLDIDGLDFMPLLNGSGNAIIEGQLLVNVPYLFRYKQSDNSLYLENPPADLDQSVPLGAILLFAGTILPSDKFVFCNGAFLDQTTYATLFALIGNTYTTDFSHEGSFQVPDLEGLTIIGERTGSGSIPNNPAHTTTAGDATIPGTVNGWTIVLPYIMRVI